MFVWFRIGTCWLPSQPKDSRSNRPVWSIPTLTTVNHISALCRNSKKSNDSVFQNVRFYSFAVFHFFEIIYLLSDFINFLLIFYSFFNIFIHFSVKKNQNTKSIEKLNQLNQWKWCIQSLSGILNLNLNLNLRSLRVWR